MVSKYLPAYRVAICGPVESLFAAMSVVSVELRIA
jgi:hypothetical protein